MTKLSELRVLQIDKYARPATVADLVAALIAEGGETIWWCAENKRTESKPCVPWRAIHASCGEALLFPIPVEEETTT